MSDFRQVDGTWWNFDLIEQIFVQRRYEKVDGKFMTNGWEIRASLRYKPEDYEENFEFFSGYFDSEEEAQCYLNCFMWNMPQPSTIKKRK
jgi:hypothetical protein